MSASGQEAWYRPSLRLRRFAHSRITLVYALVGVAWIFASDRALEWLGVPAEELGRLQTFKGWLYIAVTTFMLYLLIEHVTRTVDRADAALREQHRALATLIANLPGGVYRRVSGAPEPFEFVSPGAASLFGLKGTAATGAFLALVHPEDRTKVEERLATALDLGEPYELRYRVLCDDGGTRHVWDHGRCVSASGDRAILEGYVADVTERVQLEERLCRGQRLESLGRMASGVAHDFNNILFAVSGGCELLLREPLTPEARELASQVEQASASAHEVVAQLLAFARQQPRAPTTLTLESAVRRAEPILKRLVAQQSQLELALSPLHGKVLVDATQLEQVLLNLVTNAAHAIGKRGRVTIATGSVELSEAAAREADLAAGHYEMLSVADTGEGIPEDVLPHIFEPFFTTKGEGGTGLGLATVYSIVRQSGGGVLVASTRGCGTELRVFLPRVAEVVPEP